MEHDFDVFYIPANEENNARMIDSVRRTESGEAFGFYSNKTQQVLEAEHKQLLIGRASVVDAMIEEGYCTEPSIITEERWQYALEALPPKDWMRVNGVESFKFMEYYYGNVTSIYCKTGKGFFVFRGRASMSAAEIAEKINNYNSEVIA